MGAESGGRAARRPAAIGRHLVGIVHEPGLQVTDFRDGISDIEPRLGFILKGFANDEFDVNPPRAWLTTEPQPPQPIQPIFSLALGFPKSFTVGKAIAAAQQWRRL